MKKQLISTVLFLALMVPMTVLAVVNDCSQNTVSPAFLANGVMPSTHIVFDNSGSMNEFAYTTAFNATYPYYGIFDSRMYYSYNSTAGGDYFYENLSTGPWSGNFLNWFMRKMDVAKKVMIGGEWVGGYLRVVDANGGRAYDDNATVTDINGQTRHMTEMVNAAYRNWVSINPTTVSGTIRYDFDSAGANDISRYFRILTPTEPTGVLQQFQNRMRMSIFTFDNDGDNHNGAEIQFYMQENIGATAAAIRNSVTVINAST